MKYFIIYNNEGRILRTGSCLDSDFQYQNGQEEFILEGKADYNTQYIDNNKVVDMPTKPSGEYIFNYTSKQWEFDRVTAEKKALQQRNKLLAEGPDRINPIWWASMTTQEQAAWTQYRQDLLDITGQADYPEFIVWPIKP